MKMISCNYNPSQQVCRPTSLAFINAPNPIEPVTTQQQHPIIGASWPEQPASQNVRHILGDVGGAARNVVGPNHTRRRSVDGGGLLSLPKLPVANHREKGRLRIPPTLSGLHQPPPDAGLLPSISIEQPKDVAVPSGRKSPVVNLRNGVEETRSDGVDRQPTRNRRRGERKLTRNKWTKDETADLLKGVARFGIGNWTKILRHPDYNFNGRTAPDLKDRFRVCCPASFNDHHALDCSTQPSRPVRVDGRPCSRETKSASDLRELGIVEPFAPSTRRKRRGYSAAEDEAIVRGVEKHGNAWAVMRSDPELSVLLSRTATDLRDRYRARFPDQHKKLRLKPPSGTSNGLSNPSTNNGQTSATQSNHEEPQGTRVKSTASQSQDQITPTRAEKERPHLSTPSKRADPLQVHATYNDVFWGLPFDEFDGDGDRITLDRTILDWSFHGMNKSFENHADTTCAAGIGEIASFSSPLAATGGWSQMPNAGSEGAAEGGATAAAAVQASTSGAALPSLAIVTAAMIDGDNAEDQLELPSLMSGFGALEGDGRSGAPLMSLYDILS